MSEVFVVQIDQGTSFYEFSLVRAEKALEREWLKNQVPDKLYFLEKNDELDRSIEYKGFSLDKNSPVVYDRLAFFGRILRVVRA